MHHYLNIAVKAVRSAGKILTRYVDNLDTLKVYEKAPNTFNTLVDKTVEEEIIAIIQQAYPHHAIFGEETGHHPGEECTWIIDPISGTANFMQGYPQFAVSITIKQRDQIEHGVIYDPISQELFTATRGSGAQLNGRRLRLSKRDNLNTALIGTSFPSHHNTTHMDPYLKMFRQVGLACGNIRCTGSTALELAYVAAGRLDGYWAPGLKPWEIATGALLVREAGGFVGDFNNEEAFLENGNIIAGNRKIHAHLTQIIQQI